MFKLMWNTWVSSITGNFNITTITIDMLINHPEELKHPHTGECAYKHYPSVAEIQTAPVTLHESSNIPF